jgi:alanine racemase
MIAQHGTIEISRSRLAHNVRLVRNRVAGARLCATIKANAYGHGVDLVTDLLLKEGVDWACLYSLQEALDLAKFVALKMLVLSPLVLQEPSPKLLERILEWGGSEVRFNIVDEQCARCLAESVVAVDHKRRWPVHIQVDAGLTRMGAAPADVPALAAAIEKMPGLALEGVFAHFSHGDVPGHPSVACQLEAFHRAADPLKKARPDLILHMQNSGGALNLGHTGLDMVRVGIALYGMQPSTDDPIADLQPIARVTAPLLAIHDRPAGTGVGYGHTFVTKRASRLGIVPVGYADGYPRNMSNQCVAQVHGVDVPVVGRVSMDQIIVDLTDLSATDGPVTPGEQVTVVSWDPAKPNALDRMADTLGTIGYELATHFGSRLRRVVVS